MNMARKTRRCRPSCRCVSHLLCRKAQSEGSGRLSRSSTSIHSTSHQPIGWFSWTNLKELVFPPRINFCSCRDFFWTNGQVWLRPLQLSFSLRTYSRPFAWLVRRAPIAPWSTCFDWPIIEGVVAENKLWRQENIGWLRGDVKKLVVLGSRPDHNFRRRKYHFLFLLFKPCIRGF